MRVRTAAVAIGLAGALLAGCAVVTGLGDEYASKPAGATPGDASHGGDREAAPPGQTLDAGIDATDAAWTVPDAGTCAADACALAAPTGFALVAFSQTRSAGCPASSTALDGVESPVVGAGACTCTCAVTNPPSCSNGVLASTYDESNGCGSPGSNLLANGGQCVHNGGKFGKHAGISPPPLTNGTCTSPATGNKGAVAAREVRVCAPTGCGSACGADLPASFTTCLLANGDVACPAQAPQKHLVGADVSLACTDCSCNVTASSTCSGSMKFYNDSFCNDDLLTINTGACTFTNDSNFGSYRWNGTPQNVQCQSGAAPPGVVTLVGASTVCCP